MEGKGPVKPLSVIFIGNSSCGKTSIIARFNKNEFSEDKAATLGVEFVTKDFQTTKGTELKVKLLDTAGQERFHTLTANYFRMSQAIVLVYSVTD